MARGPDLGLPDGGAQDVGDAEGGVLRCAAARDHDRVAGAHRSADDAGELGGATADRLVPFEDAGRKGRLGFDHLGHVVRRAGPHARL